MHIGLFGKRYDEAYSHHLQLLVATLEDRGVGIVVPESYYTLIAQHISFVTQPRIVAGESLQPTVRGVEKTLHPCYIENEVIICRSKFSVRI